MKELADLGMAGTQFRVSIQREVNPQGEIEADNKRYVLYPHGLDRIEFLLSANAGEDLRQLRKVASGGEMSRIMLAIKNVILSADIVESLVFDEVDAGIGGKVAEIVGRKLKSLADNRQVLVVTHLPQIAAMSDSHYSVQKGKTGERITTLVKQLGLKEKIREIARMLAGETITDLSMKHAEEMVRNAETISHSRTMRSTCRWHLTAIITEIVQSCTLPRPYRRRTVSWSASAPTGAAAGAACTEN